MEEKSSRAQQLTHHTQELKDRRILADPLHAAGCAGQIRIGRKSADELTVCGRKAQPAKARGLVAVVMRRDYEHKRDQSQEFEGDERAAALRVSECAQRAELAAEGKMSAEEQLQKEMEEKLEAEREKRIAATQQMRYGAFLMRDRMQGGPTGNQHLRSGCA